MDPPNNVDHDAFMKSTGFGVGTNYAKKPNPPPVKNNDAARTFTDNFSSSNKVGHGATPHSEKTFPYSKGDLQSVNDQTNSLIPGHGSTQNNNINLNTPYKNVDIGKTGLTNTSNVSQRNWHTADVRDGAYGERLMGGTGEPTQKNIVMMLAISILFFVTVTSTYAALTAKKRSETNGLWMTSMFSFMIFLAIILANNSGLFSTSEGQQAEDPRKVMTKFHTRDMPDTVIDHQTPGYFPENNSSQSRYYRAQGTDPNQLEGPRANYGYKLQNEFLPSLQKETLMRDPSTHNINDQAQMDQYMARMRGAAPNQFHQAQPYMTMNAEWDNRVQNDDASTIHGISGMPDSTYARKYLIKQPRREMGGSKTMHTQDPPYGYQQPLEHVHPWVNQAQDMNEPSVMLNAPGTSEQSIGVPNQQGIPDMVQAYPQQNRNNNVAFTGDPEADAQMLVGDRERQDAMFFGDNETQKKKAELSPWLQPIETKKGAIQNTNSMRYDSNDGYNNNQPIAQQPHQTLGPMNSLQPVPINALPAHMKPVNFQNQQNFTPGGQPLYPMKQFDETEKPETPMNDWMKPVKTTVKSGFNAVPGASQAAKEYSQLRGNGASSYGQQGGLPAIPAPMFNQSQAPMIQQPPMSVNEKAESLFKAAFAEKDQPTSADVDRANSDRRS